MPQSTGQTFRAKIEGACRQASARVVRLARQTGTPVITWDPELGQVLAISPDEAEKQLALSSTPGHSEQPDHSSD
jgi:hypothetical protein